MNKGPSPDEGYQLAVRIFSVTIIGFGVAILIVTLARGGGPLAVGVLFGLLFIALGSAAVGREGSFAKDFLYPALRLPRWRNVAANVDVAQHCMTVQW